MKYKKIFICTMIMVTLSIFAGFAVRYTITSHASGLIATTTDVDVATDTDVSLYLSHKYDTASMGDIYSILLSIRNVLIMFFGFWFLTWVWQRMKIFIKLLYRGKK